MLHPVYELVPECSRVMTLEPGDLILTDTPSGFQRKALETLYPRNGGLARKSGDLETEQSILAAILWPSFAMGIETCFLSVLRVRLKSA